MTREHDERIAEHRRRIRQGVYPEPMVPVIEALLAELSAAGEALRFIGDNAESWHGDNDAKGRALGVIAHTARTLEVPEAIRQDWAAEDSHA